jgi:hypothetical protein
MRPARGVRREDATAADQAGKAHGYAIIFRKGSDESGERLHHQPRRARVRRFDAHALSDHFAVGVEDRSLEPRAADVDGEGERSLRLLRFRRGGGFGSGGRSLLFHTKMGRLPAKPGSARAFSPENLGGSGDVGSPGNPRDIAARVSCAHADMYTIRHHKTHPAYFTACPATRRRRDALARRGRRSRRCRGANS